MVFNPIMCNICRDCPADPGYKSCQICRNKGRERYKEQRTLERLTNPPSKRGRPRKY